MLFELRYIKPPLSFREQAELLQSRGLVCDNMLRCERYLSQISYYRLSAYCLPFEGISENGERTHTFKTGTTFDEILALYIFDRKLRLLVLEAIERIEVTVRTQWAAAMSLAADNGNSHAYLYVDLFKNPWGHTNDLNKIAQQLKGSKEVFVEHYHKKYTDPFLPPIWAVIETMSLGALSRWVKNTKDNSVKREMTTSLGLPNVEVMEGVLHALTPVRNICAHHGRLWNRRFTVISPIIRQLNHSMVAVDNHHQSHRYLYNFLVIIIHLLQKTSPRSSWRNRLCELVSTLDDWQLAAMGFPNNWRERTAWNSISWE